MTKEQVITSADVGEINGDVAAAVKMRFVNALFVFAGDVNQNSFKNWLKTCPFSFEGGQTIRWDGATASIKAQVRPDLVAELTDSDIDKWLLSYNGDAKIVVFGPGAAERTVREQNPVDPKLPEPVIDDNGKPHPMEGATGEAGAATPDVQTPEPDAAAK